MISAAFTDLYELTMAQGYLVHGMDRPAVFEAFFRHHPFGGGYSVFAGLGPLLEDLENLRFLPEDLAYLESRGIFSADFLAFLEAFRFRGDLWAVPEGEVVFPREPLIRVRGGLVECQLVEGLLLNRVNFQSLVATKTARVCHAAKGGRIMEFGLRRAQGPDGANSATRASYVGGAVGTSNVLGARLFGIPAMGTMAHSWIMAFPSEREAFEAYADLYPDATVFLVDTYDTLASGVPNAVAAGRRLAERGKRFGIRLDSGDIQYLAEESRKMLDAAGFRDAFIVASNDLDEEIIEALTAAGVPVDIWGVGSRLVTGGSDSAFSGVYKLAAVDRGGGLESAMKFSDNPDKSTEPGVKEVYRIYDEAGQARADVLAAEGETLEPGVPRTFHHPALDTRRFRMTPCGEIRPLLAKAMEGGKRLGPPPPLAEARDRCKAELGRFDPTYRRLLNPHVYKVSITDAVRDLKASFLERYRAGT